MVEYKTHFRTEANGCTALQRKDLLHFQFVVRHLLTCSTEPIVKSLNVVNQFSWLPILSVLAFFHGNGRKRIVVFLQSCVVDI